MKEKYIRQNSPKAWMLAARPKTLSGAAVPVMIGLSITYANDGATGFNFIPAVFCVLFAFIMQIDANFINDYYDCVRGNDDETRLGPRRACAQGWITPKAMKRAIVITTLTACLIGMPLIMYGGIEMVVIGVLCVVFCFLYTTTLSYLGMGDLLVLVFFGLVPVCTTYYILTGEVGADTVIASISCGLVIDTLLIINNYRDIDNDIKAGKKTLLVRLGSSKGRKAYLFTGVLAVAIGAVFITLHHFYAAILPLAYLFPHYATYREMVRINKGKALNHVLGKTARNIFIYGLLVSIGFLL